MTEKALPSMVAQLEDSITRNFYAKDAVEHRSLCHAVGLQTPLWLWTHDGEHQPAMAPAGSMRPNGTHTQRALHECKDVRKVCHLMEWLLRNQVDLASVAVLVPLSLKEPLRAELASYLGGGAASHVGDAAGATATPLPVVLAQHELTAMNLRDKTHYTHDVVVYVLGVPPDTAAIPQAVSQGDFISEALGAARRAFVMLVDSAWTGPYFTAKWSQWKIFLSKLREEEPPVSVVSKGDGITSAVEGASGEGVARLPGLVGSSLPLCCARHPNQRQLAYGLTPIVPECKRLCLRHYDCGIDVHVCREACHPSRRHGGCPFICNRALPCGHDCLLPCSSRCNCFEVIERPLPCSHQEVLGLDPDTLEPIYGTVQHVFKGSCADAELPCVVEYSTECARCLGSLTVRCFEAQEHGHTAHSRTLLCDTCKRTERELRAQILGEVLFGAEAEKKKLKVELQRALHQQRKAAAQGLFTPGVKVEIHDATKCVPPLLADEDFPGVVFVDMDAPDFFTSMEGAYGTFISSHVDVMDRTELRNLVRLPDGKHVLVADGGLRMIRALTTQVTGASSTALLLTAKPHVEGDASVVETAGGNAPEFAKAKSMVGSMYYLSEPVPCAGVEGGMVSDKVVTVVAVDPSSTDGVVAECCVVRRCREDDDQEQRAATASAPADADEPHGKKPRLEEGAAVPPAAGCEVVVLRFAVPIAALEPMRGYGKGQYVYVGNPERQITDPHIMADLEIAVHLLLPPTAPAAAAGGPPPPSKLTAAPANPDVAYELLGIVNPPLWLCGRGDGGTDADAIAAEDGAETEGLNQRLGPCAILRPRTTSGVVATSSKMSHRSTLSRLRTCGRPAAASHTPAAAATTGTRGTGTLAERPLVAVPFMFTTPDELTEAENALDAAAQQRFEERLHAAIAARSEELSLRNDEEAFHAQQQMGEVTAARRAEQRTAFSVPVPLPTAEHVAAVRRRHLQLPVATAVTARVAQAKDALAAKAEAKDLAAWVEAMGARFAQDRESSEIHIRSVQAEQQRIQQPQRVKHGAQPPQHHYSRRY